VNEKDDSADDVENKFRINKEREIINYLLISLISCYSNVFVDYNNLKTIPFLFYSSVNSTSIKESPNIYQISLVFFYFLFFYFEFPIFIYLIIKFNFILFKALRSSYPTSLLNYLSTIIYINKTNPIDSVENSLSILNRKENIEDFFTTNFNSDEIIS
jgi:hypothetical protein